MYQLPGLAAKSTLYEFTDSYKRPFALLHVPATSHFTVIFSTEPDGASLVDPEQVDAWVANWGGWLAGLGRRGRPGRRRRHGRDRTGLRLPAAQ